MPTNIQQTIETTAAASLSMTALNSKKIADTIAERITAAKDLGPIMSSLLELSVADSAPARTWPTKHAKIPVASHSSPIGA